MKKNSDQAASLSENHVRLGRKGLLVALAGFVLVVVLIIGIPYYLKVLAPRYQTLLQVGKTTFNTQDLIKRLRLNPAGQEGGQLETATQLLQEMMHLELIRQEALKQKIVIPEKILNQEIQRRVMASASPEEKFEDRYGSMLRRAGLKEKEFRTWVELDIYRGLLFQNFLEKIPRKAEHIDLLAIITPPGNKAEMIRTGLQKGQDFNRLAAENSIDLESARKGGEIGWMPKGVDEMMTPGQIQGLGILAKTRSEAEKIREQVLSGKNFAELARTYSLDRETGERGGQTGWVSAGFQEGKAYAAEVYELNPGEVSPPVSTPEGFWIIKLIEKTPRGKVIDDIAFNLPPGQVSPPLNTVKGIYFLKIKGKELHPLSEDHRAKLANKTFSDWQAELAKKGAAEGWIKWDWGSEIFNWVVTHLN
ncbi:MAG: peptidylprolyl isomerase [Deltaproteobacteria bacterium]|nr:peptidylprolyl isomerase [Deltaproteobacteria bacterium]